MPRLAHRDQQIVHDLVRSIRTIDLARPEILQPVADQLCEARIVDVAFSYNVRSEHASFALAGCGHSGTGLAAGRVQKLVQDYVGRSRQRIGLYDPLRPEPPQRNRVVSASIAEAVAGSAPYYGRLFAPMGLLDSHQLRVLVCDDSHLLAYVGGNTCAPPTARQRSMLQALVPALRERLALQEQLHSNTVLQHALEVAMDELPGAAFLVGPSRAIEHANHAGHRRLTSRRAETHAEIADALRAAAPGVRQLAAIPLRAVGLGPYHLVIERATREPLAASITAARGRYGLTPRETEVLALVASGNSNKAIASELECAERTVEVHVGRLLAKLDVDSRSAVICVLLAGGAVH